MGQALVKMVNDGDHLVRMHMAKAVTVLYHSVAQATAHASHIRTVQQLCPPKHSRKMAGLLSCAEQEHVFQEILQVLQLAFVFSEGLDELSAEDESVNRVASRIHTLLLSACVSPVCQRKVVGELVMAVDHIDTDLVAKVCMLCVCEGESTLMLTWWPRCACCVCV